LRRRACRSIAVAGYSLGGNVALKLAGELGADAPRELTAVCAVSPDRWTSRCCVDALERRANYPYQVELRAQPEGAHAAERPRSSPTSSRWSRWERIWTVRQFDEAYTAPYYGFKDATDYYHRASAMRAIDRI
jgi:predicted alpha/beta-fold hydrolase